MRRAAGVLLIAIVNMNCSFGPYRSCPVQSTGDKVSEPIAVEIAPGDVASKARVMLWQWIVNYDGWYGFEVLATAIHHRTRVVRI